MRQWAEDEADGKSLPAQEQSLPVSVRSLDSRQAPHDPGSTIP